MITVSVQIHNLDQLRRNVSKAPQLALKYLGKATEAAIFEVEREATDKNFQFVTPRGQRTGMLERSFKYGRYIHPSKLMASIGPTVHYAPYVYFGTRRGIHPNPYMDRIARAAEPQVNRHFEKAVDLFLNQITS